MKLTIEEQLFNSVQFNYFVVHHRRLATLDGTLMFNIISMSSLNIGRMNGHPVLWRKAHLRSEAGHMSSWSPQKGIPGGNRTPCSISQHDVFQSP